MKVCVAARNSRVVVASAPSSATSAIKVIRFLGSNVMSRVDPLINTGKCWKIRVLGGRFGENEMNIKCSTTIAHRKKRKNDHLAEVPWTSQETVHRGAPPIAEPVGLGLDLTWSCERPEETLEQFRSLR